MTGRPLRLGTRQSPMALSQSRLEARKNTSRNGREV